MKSGYCTIMWNGRDNRASKMNHHQPHQRVVFSQESDVWWNWKGVLYYELLLENQTIPTSPVPI